VVIGRKKRAAATDAAGADDAAASASAAESVTVTPRTVPIEPLAGDPAVPAGVLSELLAAFSESPSDIDGEPVKPSTGFDFDDPSIDRLLAVGLDDPAGATGARDAIDASRATDIGEVSEYAPPPAIRDPGIAASKRVVIGGDDLPDAQYLDGAIEPPVREPSRRSPSRDDSGERATIVIADLDDVHDIEAPARRSGGSIDPRLRARRAAVRRAEGRRRLFWVAVVGGVIVIAVGVLATLASSLFSVDEVEVQGVVYTDQQRLEAIIAEVKGDPILLVDTRAIEQQLEDIAWVERARVETHFPHLLTIDVRERQPVATFAGSDGKFRIIDRESRVLDVIDGIPLAPMLITGNHPDTDIGQFAGAPYAAAAQLVIALPAEIRTITTSVGVDSATGELTMLLNDSVEVRLGAASDLPIKLARLLQRVRDGIDGVEQLDVSTDAVGA
jgi:cell division protein FtsQ